MMPHVVPFKEWRGCRRRPRRGCLHRRCGITCKFLICFFLCSPKGMTWIWKQQRGNLRIKCVIFFCTQRDTNHRFYKPTNGLSETLCANGLPAAYGRRQLIYVPLRFPKGDDVKAIGRRQTICCTYIVPFGLPEAPKGFPEGVASVRFPKRDDARRRQLFCWVFDRRLIIVRKQKFLKFTKKRNKH